VSTPIDPRRAPRLPQAPAVIAFKQTPEYQNASVIERERMLFAAFPAIEVVYKAASAAHLESIVYPT
jgi:hypothetical protein